MSDKPLRPKPQVYAFLFAPMQEIARGMGYNLLMHGSLNRDCDLVAVPWVNEPASEMELLQALDMFLRGESWETKEQYLHSILPGGRAAYVLNINRGSVSKYGEWSWSEDSQWYIDISITPLFVNNQIN